MNLSPRGQIVEIFHMVKKAVNAVEETQGNYMSSAQSSWTDRGTAFIVIKNYHNRNETILQIDVVENTISVIKETEVELKENAEVLLKGNSRSYPFRKYDKYTLPRDKKDRDEFILNLADNNYNANIFFN